MVSFSSSFFFEEWSRIAQALDGDSFFPDGQIL